VEGAFDFGGVRFRVMDTAGIRRKGKVRESVEYYSVNRAIGSISECELVFLLVDAEEDISDQDKKIAALAVRAGRGVILVLSKWDRLDEVPNRLHAIQDRVSFLFPQLDFAPVVPVSGLTGYNLEALMKTARQVHEQLICRIDTPRLNKALGEWVATRPPSGRYNVKIRYGVHASANPHKFLFFANRTKGLPVHYSRYLVGCIRKQFKLTMVPISVEVRVGQERSAAYHV
jgi:GTP-binding protein